MIEWLLVLSSGLPVRPAVASQNPVGQNENNKPGQRHRGQFQIDRQGRPAPSVGSDWTPFHFLFS
jgi:hypothetical protein